MKMTFLRAPEEFLKKFGHSYDAEFYGESIADGYGAIKQVPGIEKHN